MKIKKYDKLLWSNGEQFRLKYNSYIFNNGYRIINWISRGYVELEKLVGKLQSAINESYKGFDISWSLLNNYIPTKVLKKCLKEAKESKDE